MKKITHYYAEKYISIFNRKTKHLKIKFNFQVYNLICAITF